jgi:hypothetical protein
MRAGERMQMLATGFVVLGACLLLTQQSWAAGGFNPDGNPPFGVAPQSDAKGTRLQGVFVIEFLNVDPMTGDANDGARGILRLRKGSQLEDYNSLLPGPVAYGTGGEQQAVQAALIDAMGQDVLDDFLPGEQACAATAEVCPDDCACIKVKRLDEFVQVDPDENPDLTKDQFFVMDIELAVD